jgi:hypothetical protein
MAIVSTVASAGASIAVGVGTQVISKALSVTPAGQILVAVAAVGGAVGAAVGDYTSGRGINLEDIAAGAMGGAVFAEVAEFTGSMTAAGAASGAATDAFTQGWKFVATGGHSGFDPTELAESTAGGALAGGIGGKVFGKGGESSSESAKAPVSNDSGTGQTAHYNSKPATGATKLEPLSVQENPGSTIYRSGGRSPSNLSVRPGEAGLSFRDSISNPSDGGTSPVFEPGEEFIAVDSSQLPEGSVARDGNPPGHVTVSGASPAQIKNAITYKSRILPGRVNG